MITAAFFDVDGVIRHFGHTDVRIRSIAFDPEILQPAVTGAITDSAWRRTIDARAVALLGDAAVPLLAVFHQAPHRIDHEVLDLVGQVRRRAKVGLLTNQTDAFESWLASSGLADQFDAIANSARIGHSKPRPEIYECAADLLGVTPSECLFVDDTPANVDAAASIGMHAVLYTGTGALRGSLARFGLV